MQMIHVTSSNISSVGYADTLYVEFNSGALYAYSGVPVNVFQSLMNASSPGGYLAAHVKNVYPYARIR